jgi:hypothetical protein
MRRRAEREWTTSLPSCSERDTRGTVRMAGGGNHSKITIRVYDKVQNWLRPWVEFDVSFASLWVLRVCEFLEALWRGARCEIWEIRGVGRFHTKNLQKTRKVSRLIGTHALTTNWQSRLMVPMAKSSDNKIASFRDSIYYVLWMSAQRRRAQSILCYSGPILIFAWWYTCDYVMHILPSALHCWLWNDKNLKTAPVHSANWAQ